MTCDPDPEECPMCHREMFQLLRLNSPVGVGGRWEADVDADVDVLLLFCTVACTVCSVEFEMGGGMGRLVSSALEQELAGVWHARSSGVRVVGVSWIII